MKRKSIVVMCTKPYTSIWFLLYYGYTRQFHLNERSYQKPKWFFFCGLLLSNIKLKCYLVCCRQLNTTKKNESVSNLCLSELPYYHHKYHSIALLRYIASSSHSNFCFCQMQNFFSFLNILCIVARSI